MVIEEVTFHQFTRQSSFALEIMYVIYFRLTESGLMKHLCSNMNMNRFERAPSLFHIEYIIKNNEEVRHERILLVMNRNTVMVA